MNTIIDQIPLDKKKLNGRRGADAITKHLKKKKETTWRFTIAAIKMIWTMGLELAWPAEMKEVRPPTTGQAWTPEDETVKAWYLAVLKDHDEYFRLIFLLIAQHGWRPSHLAHMKWRNIVYEAGKPVKVQADGYVEGFKTKAVVEAWLCPQVQEALIAWTAKEEVRTVRRDDGVIIPHRDRNGNYHFEEVVSHLFVMRLHVLWHDFQKRWRLPALMPKGLRHWVATKTREAGLSVPATARMMGHDVDKSIMRQVYDNPRSVRVEQRTKLPNGVLGLLCPPSVEVIEDIPGEALEVLRLRKAKKIGFIDMCQRLETIMDQQPTQTKDIETV
jgi:integrase